MTRFGSFDPLYPNGIMSAANEEHLFGVRLVLFDTELGSMSEGRSLQWDQIKTGPNHNTLHYSFTSSLNGKHVQLQWSRTGENAVFGKVTMEKGLSVLLEAYVPRERRLNKSWPNFTVMNEYTIAGEMVSPYPIPQNNSMRVLCRPDPQACLGYNNRARMLAHIQESGRLERVEPANIWHDMGLNWLAGALFTADFTFLYQVGEAEEFIEIANKAERDRLLADHRELYEKNKTKLSEVMLLTGGALGTIGEAIASAGAYNTMYREDVGKRYIITDREWVKSEDSWGLAFNWDSFLQGYLVGWDDLELGKEALSLAMDLQLPDGRIAQRTNPYCGHSAEPYIIAGRSQHIVTGFCFWKSYLMHKDKKWLSEHYPRIKKSHQWWFGDRGDGQSWRDGAGLGLLSFGYDPELEMGKIGARYQPYVGKAQYAYFETYDDSPQWTTGKYFKTTENFRDLTETEVEDEAKYLEAAHTVDMYTLERTCLYTVESDCLMRMAQELGIEQDARYFAQETKTMRERINAHMWDEKECCYFNLKYDGTFSRVYSPDIFLPLWCGAADAEKAEHMMGILLDEKKFWGEYVIPSIAKDHPSYHEQAYWRGQIWPPMLLWTYQSIKAAGYEQEAEVFADKVVPLLDREWRDHCYFPENFNGSTGACAGAKHYAWGLLAGVIGLESFVEIGYDSICFGRDRMEQDVMIHNIKLPEGTYSYDCEKGEGLVTRNGVCLKKGKGKLVVSRE